MRTILPFFTITTLVACAVLSARQQDGSNPIRLRLLDAETGQPLPGIIRISADGKPIALPGLYDRLKGLQKSDAKTGWYVLPAEGATIPLPKGSLRLEALSGLETALVRQDIDPTKSGDVTVKLPMLFRPEKVGLVAGNTHLHLMKLTMDDAKEYLWQIPKADGIKVMFISYLERHKDDVGYITNKLPVGDLAEFGKTGVLFNNGEEHRHNFDGYGEGYGHVMLLNIKELVKPVSIGPGIMGVGFDDTPLYPGLDNARKQGGTIIWCHNTNGTEDVPNALAGRLDALNVFDGSRRGLYEDTYYRFLNIGMRLPISTGTDWFIYDFSRVYAKVPGKLTIPAWLQAVKAGRCQATNGPLLTLTVDGKEPGDVIAQDQPRAVKVVASAIGRADFQLLELVHNGKVIDTKATTPKDGGFSAKLEAAVRLDGPAWLAARVQTKTRNEFDEILFAHTSPVYVDVAGKPVFDLEAAQALLKMLEQGHADILAKGKFSNDEARDKLLGLYRQSEKELAKRISQRRP